MNETGIINRGINIYIGGMRVRLEIRKYNILDSIKLPLKYSPIYAILIAVVKVLDGIIPILQVMVMAEFIDTSISVASMNGDIRKVFPSMLGVVAIVAYGWVSETIISFFDVKLEIQLREKLRLEVVEKRARLSYKYIESSESWDLIARVCKDIEVKVKDGYKNILSLIALIINVVGILSILIAKVWWAALIISVFSIPLFVLAIKGGKANYDTQKEILKHIRKYEYLGEVLAGREAAEERSLFDYSEDVNDMWWEQYETSRKAMQITEGKWMIRIKMGSVIFSFIAIFIIAVLINPVINGLITVGIFMSIVNAVNSLIKTMSWQLSAMLSDIAKNREYLKDLTNFMALEEEEEATDKPLENITKFETLEFKNVRFKYPETDNYILDGMSFIIEAGKHYAFVGINGAGKTTVTKLITGLYKDYEGDILVNGKNIKEHSQGYLKALCSVVYQDFAKYFISFKDNISLGCVNEINDERIFKAINTMELNDVVENLPNRVESLLGKIKKGGVDLSGGQWQRVAMARSIVSPAPLRILDEPTAALDPISESTIYEKFEDISKGGTTIFISHRLGSTKLANEIFVLGEGRVLERGSHIELINKNGVYAEMYESQKGWYM